MTNEQKVIEKLIELGYKSTKWNPDKDFVFSEYGVNDSDKVKLAWSKVAGVFYISAGAANLSVKGSLRYVTEMNKVMGQVIELNSILDGRWKTEVH